MKNRYKTVPLWTDISPAPKTYSWLNDDENCDVCVIGGGITGALTAMKFACAGIDTVLVSAMPIGYGKTSRSPACGRYDSVGTLFSLYDKIGIESAVRIYGEQKNAIEFLENFSDYSEIDFGFKKRDCLLFTADDAERERIFKEFRLRKAHGFDVEYLSKSAMSEFFSFETEGGIISRQLAVELNPYLLTHAAVAEAQKSGARIYENTQVKSVLRESGRNVLKTSSRRNIYCKNMIIAVGHECSDYVKGLGQTHTLASLVSRPIELFDGWRERCVISCIDNPAFTLSSTPDSRLFITGSRSSVLDEEGYLHGFVPLEYIQQKRFLQLEETAGEIFPRINLSFEYGFCSSFNAGFADLPVTDRHPEYDGCYYSAGGAEASPLTAVAAARALGGMCLGNLAGNGSVFLMRR